jgi:hypothetical protein
LYNYNNDTILEREKYRKTGRQEDRKTGRHVLFD